MSTQDNDSDYDNGSHNDNESAPVAEVVVDAVDEVVVDEFEVSIAHFHIPAGAHSKLRRTCPAF